MKTPVLIVENEIRTAAEIATLIEKQPYGVVAVTTDAHHACMQALRHKPHVIFIAIELGEGMDGVTLAHTILQNLQTTIIYITTGDESTGIERSVRTNPATYLMKPLTSGKILVAFKMALLRYKKHAATLHVKQDDVVLNEAFRYSKTQRQLFHFSTPVHLTARENELLNLLVETRHSVLSTYNMENILWPDMPPAESTRRALVSRLRAKLNHQGIETVPGIGYRLSF